MTQLGLGVMIQSLGGNKDSAEIIAASIGKKISELSMDNESLTFKFEDGSGMRLSDQGQSCCEHRYLNTKADLQKYVGAKLKSAKFKDEYAGSAEYDEHEVQPVEIETTKGKFVIEHHNEHNGYYGGFWIVANAI